MFKARWMILAGAILILIGLANTFYGLRQTASSPFDDASAPQHDIVDLAATFTPFPSPTLSPAATSDETPSLSDQPEAVPTRPSGLTPDRIVIPSIQLDAPIEPTTVKKIDYQDKTYYQWVVPDHFAAGWHNTSALLGDIGNTVISGHHNVHGKVFKDLVTLREGDLIDVYSGDVKFSYQVAYTLLLPERFQTLTVREENARWILPSDDERLTLITCWPAASNTHRVIVVAFPLK
jgi:LPXTG-site transpeptidase (sortase) family protein